MQESGNRVEAKRRKETCIVTIPVEANTPVEPYVVIKLVEADFFALLAATHIFWLQQAKKYFFPIFRKRVERILIT